LIAFQPRRNAFTLAARAKRNCADHRPLLPLHSTADPTPEIPTQSSSPSAEQPKLPTDANKPAAEAKLSNDDPSADAGSSGKSITPSKAPTDTEERLASMAQQEEGGKAANVDKPATEAKEKGGKRMDELEHDMRGPVGAS